MKDYVIVISNGRGSITFVTEEELMNGEANFNLEDIFYNYFWVNSEKVEVWNEFVRENWSGLDDGYFYNYTEPLIGKELCNAWLCYDSDNGISTIKEYKEQLLEQIAFVEKSINFLNKLSF